ncbi:MAG: DUF1697 domain-containing protein [Patescibacteria group bacterium]
METYIALLRGINVGGNNRVEMPKLKKCFESLGFKSVSTYINTGNVIFEGKNKKQEALAAEIEKALGKTFGFEVRVVIRTAKDIRVLSEKMPSAWKNDTDQKTDVLFLWDKFDTKATLTQIATNPDVDRLRYFPGAIIWNVHRADYAKSGMNKFVGTVVYKHMTARNINTVRKLSQLVAGTKASKIKR